MQPALEPEWDTDPWEVAAVDGYLYGRGTSDNKGPVLAFIYAVKELQFDADELTSTLRDKHAINWQPLV